jgi:ribonucleoside-diphosphate reductase alpha chain
MYTDYEKAGRKTIKAHELWEKILESQVRQEHHTCCTKMQQPQIKPKKSRYYSFVNLCTEIMEFTSKTKLQYVTWLRCHCQCFENGHSITICFIP